MHLKSSLIKNNNGIPDDISEIEKDMGSENDAISTYKNFMGINDENIITRKEDILTKIQLLEANKRYNSPFERDDSAIISNNKYERVSTMRSNLKELQNIRKQYYDTLPSKPQKQVLQPHKTLQSSAKFNRLHSVKRSCEVTNRDPFLASEFRGLLYADYQEALNNCDTVSSQLAKFGTQTLTNFDKESLASTNFLGSRRKSNATKELFPSPYDLTKYNLSSSLKLRNKSSNKASNTAIGFYSAPKETEK